MNACADLDNKIFPRNLISFYGEPYDDLLMITTARERRELIIKRGIILPFHPFELYICRYLRGRWRWEEVAHMPKYCWNKSQRRIMNILQQGVLRYFEEDYKKQPKHNTLSPIQISNTPGSRSDKINGIYYPILELCPHPNSPMIYLKKNSDSECNYFNRHGDRNCIWLYWIPRENDYGQWWVGNTYFMKKGQSFGFMKQDNISTDEILPVVSANINWKVWTGNDFDHEYPGRWLDKDGNNSLSTRSICIKRLQYNYDGSFKEDPNQEIKDEFKNLKIATKNSIDNYHQIAQQLWNYFPQEQRCCLWEKEKALQVLLDKNKICKCCFAVSKNKVRCIHFDCPGACLECTESNGGNEDCIACERKQIVKCPICFEEESSKYLRIFKCRHFVCQRCFIAAFEKKKPIKKCPCCRKAIYDK